MLVQLSPWQTVSTSVTLPAAKRRRKRSDSASSLSESLEERPLEFVASFVSSSRRSRPLKQHSGSLFSTTKEPLPLVAITSAHRVSVVGQPRSSSRLQQSEESPLLQECTDWQFMSRPGRRASFFQQEETRINGSSCVSTDCLPRVPAIFDARNEKVYALQMENTTLCCWNSSDESGPDDCDSPASKIALQSPAISLSLLAGNKGVVYGSCLDGSLFIGRWAHGEEKESFQVQYAKSECDDRHIFTQMQLVGGGAGEAVGQKRKAGPHHHGGGDDAVVYRVNVKSNEILLYRRDVRISGDNDEEDCNAEACSLDILPGAIEEGLVVDPLSIIVTPVDESTIAVVYAVGAVANGKLKSKRTVRRTYCAIISLATGQLVRTPFILANFTRHAGAVTSSLLAVGTLDEVLLYDLLRGAIVYRCFVTELVGDCKNWVLITEAKKHRLAILSAQDGSAHVCLAKAALDQKTLEGGFSLAVGLRSSLASPLSQVEALSALPLTTTFKHLMSSKQSTDPDGCLRDCVNTCIVRLGACIDEIQDPDILDVLPYHFLEEYERCIAVIQAASPSVLLSGKQDENNATPVNGLHHVKVSNIDQNKLSANTTEKHIVTDSSTESPINGQKSTTPLVRGHTPSDIPQQFLDRATIIVLSTLQLPQFDNKAVGLRVKLARLDARLILSRLICTGKLSARRHFDSNVDCPYGRGRDGEDVGDCLFTILRSLKLTNKKGRRVFSPVDMMHEMLKWCPDVSERQMVTMIHYMLCKAMPEDIAEHFLDGRDLGKEHPYRLLAQRFFRLRSATRKQQLMGKVSEKEMAQLKKQESVLSAKLMRAGILSLVRQMIQYSRCNETLLRNAFLEGLPIKHEPLILSRVLLKLLEKEGAEAAQPRWTCTPLTESISRWIYTLCEACHERLVASEQDGEEPDGESPMTTILRSVQATLDHTEAVISLRDVLYRFGTSSKSEEEEQDKEAPDVTKPVDREVAPGAPYSIERLAF